MATATKSLGRPLHALAAALALALLGLLALAPASNALPGKFWGIVPQGLPSAETFARMKRGGVDSVRVPVYWNAVQPTAGVAPDFSSVDKAVGGAAAAGLDVLPFVNGAPSWAVPSVPVPGSGGSSLAPRNLPVAGAARGAWIAFVKLAVARYGPGGSFWAENPAIPPRPLRTWQVWNEQNFKYFVVRPNPAEYGKLLKISHTAIKSVDPGAKIILGGMFARPREAQFTVKPPQAYFAAEFLDLMYRRTPGIKSKFDGVALHPYTSKYQYLAPEMEEVRAVMKRHGDAGAEFWITELGWSSGRPQQGNSFAKGPSGQVRELRGAFSTLRKGAAQWRLKSVYWFSLEDAPGACNFCDGSGLFTEALAPKASWRAYVSFAGGKAS